MSYLSELRDHIKLDPEIRDEFLHELNSHLEDKSEEFKAQGLSEEDARERALESLGPSKLIAKQIYEVYSQGSWKQALGAALPHLLVAALFAFNLMPIIWVISLSSLSIGAVIYGWIRGRPSWLFPWLGYLLLPAIMTGTMLIYLPSGWTWFAVVTYIPLAFFILILVIKQTLKRDWLFISLMLLPIPITLGWTLAFSLGSDYLDTERIYETASWITLSFMILALTAAIFIRVRTRLMKIWVMVVPEVLVLAVITLNSDSSISLWGWFLLVLLALALIFSPAVLERMSKNHL